MVARRSIRQYKNNEQLNQIINFEKIVRFKGGQTITNALKKNSL